MAMGGTLKEDIPAGSERIERGSQQWEQLHRVLGRHWHGDVVEALGRKSEYDALYLTADGERLYGVYGTEEVFADLVVDESDLETLGRRTWRSR